MTQNSQLYRSLGKERVFVVRDGRRLGEDNRDYIEPDPAPIGAAAQHVRAGRANDAFLFFRIHSAFGGSVGRTAPGFHFDKNKCFAKAADDINFAAAIRQPEVARHDLQALAAEVSMRNILSLAPQGLIGGQ